MEAVERVEKILGIKHRDLPHFRTIHSMAFKALKLRDGDVMGREQLSAFGNAMGLRFGASALSELAAEGITSADKGDVMLAIDNMARLRGVTVRKAWSDANSAVDWPTMSHFAASYSRYKTDTGLLDFTDVLAEYINNPQPLDVEVAFIDEAQDLSKLQWNAALAAVGHAPVQYVAGDDDQAIYRWAGADVGEFINLPGERIVLERSHRLPRAIHSLAQRISSRIKVRVPKDFSPRDDDGAVHSHASMASLDINNGHEWLWLVRNRFLLPTLRDELQLRGAVYSEHGSSSIRATERDAIYAWERLRAGKRIYATAARDIYSYLKTRTQVAHGHKLLPKLDDNETVTMQQLREHHGLLVDGTWYDVLTGIDSNRKTYYRKLLRLHHTLKLEPMISLETIHGSKGTEAPHVALFTEQSRKVWHEATKSPDDEHRVWYVGATRARQSLHIVMPSGQWHYNMPKNTS